MSVRRIVAEGGLLSGACLPAALGNLLLATFELAMNTLSFARVGAFALGHAALSLAIMTLAHAFTHPLAVALPARSPRPSAGRPAPLRPGRRHPERAPGRGE